MRLSIHNPYMDTLGGGELYTLALAKVAQSLGYEVHFEFRNSKILSSLEKRFDINLGEFRVISNIKRGDGYDACFWVSDGSIPMLLSRKNILHFQVPFTNIGGRTLINKMKLFRISEVIVNSKFTKSFIDKEYGVNSLVIYPPVDVVKISPPTRKENVILYVGRFSTLMQSKNQDILVEVFKKLLQKKVGRWRLVLAGGVEVGVDDQIKKLKQRANGYPVTILESPSRKTLVSLFSKAKIFWSAVGFGADELKVPEKVEHFGISVVEAMAGGAVPICFSAGGYREILENGVNGFLWKKKSDLLESTFQIIKKAGVMQRLSKQAVVSSNRFSFDKFNSAVVPLFK